MTANSMTSWVGRQVYIEPSRGMFVLCNVVDVKSAYGKQRLQIEPVAGQGRTWIDAYKARTQAPLCSRCKELITDAEYLDGDDGLRHIICRKEEKQYKSEMSALLKGNL